MSTTWTLLAGDICTDALQHLNVVGEGEAASGEEMQRALRGLDTVLKELPLAGYSWPKLSGESALTWVSGQTIDLPADYYGFLVAWKTVDGRKHPLDSIAHGDWVRMLNREAVGLVTKFYISPDKKLWLWPIPTVDPAISIQYQRIVDDASVNVTPDVLQAMKGALAYGVADEISLKCAVPQAIRAEVKGRWMEKKARMLESAIPSDVISFEVRE